MRHRLAGALAFGLLAAGLAGGRTSAQASPITAQLDRYLRGDFGAVAAELAEVTDFGDVLNDLRHQGPAWIAAGAAADSARRQLAAATFALEATRAAEGEDWKRVQRAFNAPAVVWRAPPQILEWGCAIVRSASLPQPVERIWHLAAIAVAQRRSDYEFLIGSPWEPRWMPSDEVDHLKHAMERLPNEPRFSLAQAIAIEWRTWPTNERHPRTAVRNLAEATRAFEGQTKDPVIGAEATLRLGYVRMRGRNLGGAMELFERVQTMTRDRYLIYLAHYFTGQIHERQNRAADAERAYRRALDTIPHVTSSTMALSAILVRTARRTEASALVEASLAVRPQPMDPWRGYAAADDRFWPELIARLHSEIRR